ncbi:MAG TPA: hypothetical protein VHE30_30610 [Polyangiaceae bacterium]|nr:hypothetical protein [Polyangiaceae bacterium]
MNRLLGLSTLTLAAALVVGCGSDSGGNIFPSGGTGGGENTGGTENTGGGSSAGSSGASGSSSGGGANTGGGESTGGDANTGGTPTDSGTGSGGAQETGGDQGAGGSDASVPGNGGASGDGGSGNGGTPGAGGASAGGASAGGASSGGASSGGAPGAGGASAGGAPGNGGASAGGAPGAGGAGTGGTGAGGAPGTCGGVKCDATATCTSNKCVCPAGTTDKNGNGTKCTKPNGGTCAADADCTSTHCVGGSCCGVACNTPGTCQRTQGTVCVGGNTCQYGKALDGTTCDDGDACTTSSCFDGTCSVDTVKDCTPTSKCETETCNSVTGNCDSTPIACNDNNPCTNDSCSATLGCQFVPNTNPCNDGSACTTGDKCSNGTCKGTAVNCNDNNVCTTDSCNPASGCVHTNNQATCDDGKSCTTTSKCSGGSCVGSGNACGALATGCVECSSGASCFNPPNGRDCTCPATSGSTPVLEQNGQCVLNTDECASDPCGAFGTGCIDPTPTAPASGDYQCTCAQGTTGNTVGTSCKDLNECTTGSPCGAGASGCTNLNPPNFYSCTCKAGYKSTPTANGPVCACDMTGTWVEAATTTVSWSGIPTITDGTNVPTYGWSLREQTIASDGTLTVTTVPCGGMAPTLCGGSTGYAQYQPVASWGKARMRSGIPTIGPVNVSGTVPGGSYSEPIVASLMGIDLADPMGAWPSSRACVNAGTCANAATWWSNAEGTGKLGVTTVAVRAGGDLIGGAVPDPPVNYPVPGECPRGTGGGDYAAWPGLVVIFPFTTYQWYGASRIQSGLSSTSVTFDAAANACVITGDVTGPDKTAANKPIPHTDARIVGCETGTNANPGAACSDAQAGFYDSNAQGQQITSATFKLEKIALTGTPLATLLTNGDETGLAAACQQVRVKYCPPGRTCN